MACWACAVALLLLMTSPTNSQDTCLNKTHSIYYEVTKACYFMGGIGSPMTTWVESEARCQQEGSRGHLVDILDQGEQDTVTTLVARTFGTSELLGPQVAWTGLKQDQSSRWAYLAPGTYLRYQGCRAPSGYEYQNRTQENSDVVTVGQCITSCASQEPVYAILRGGRYCYCSANVSSMPSSGCDMPCTGDAFQTCGGEDAESVYVFGGDRSEWTPGQPAGEKGMEDCAALVFVADEPGLQARWRLADEPCDERHMGMCKLPTMRCFTSTSMEGPRYHLSGGCYWLSTANLTWYEYQRLCAHEGGTLVNRYGMEVFSMLDPLLRQITDTTLSFSISGASKIWMGVTRRTFQWSSGADDQFINWAPEEPSQQECMAMGRNPDTSVTTSDSQPPVLFTTPPTVLPFTTPSTAPPFTTPSTVSSVNPDLSRHWGLWTAHSCSLRLFYICKIPLCFSGGARCIRCEASNATRCAECEDGFLPHPDGHCAESCMSAQTGCTACNPAEPSRCSACQESYFLDNGVCKESCFVRDPNCVTCDLIDRTVCETCAATHFIQLVNSLFCQARCTTRDPNCLFCLPTDPSMCEVCVDGFFIQEGTGGLCNDGFFGNALVERALEETSTNMLMLFELPDDLTMPREINSWNYYAAITGASIFLMLWRREAGTQFTLVASQFHTAVETGPQFVPTAAPVTMEPGDLMGLYWPLQCPIPYDDDTADGARVARQADCPSGKVYGATGPNNGFVVGQTYLVSDMSPICRAFSFQLGLTPVATTAASTEITTAQTESTSLDVTSVSSTEPGSTGATQTVSIYETTASTGITIGETPTKGVVVTETSSNSAAPLFTNATATGDTSPVTPTTNTPSNTTHTPTDTTTGSGGVPGAGASTNNNSNSSMDIFEIIMIILIAILIILVIIAIIMLLKARKNNAAENVQVKPEVVDMRDEANSPDTDSYAY